MTYLRVLFKFVSSNKGFNTYRMGMVFYGFVSHMAVMETSVGSAYVHDYSNVIILFFVHSQLKYAFLDLHYTRY